MVVQDGNRFRVAIHPGKAETVLLIDADAVLSRAISTQGFQSIAWRRAQEFEAFRRIEQGQFSLRNRSRTGFAYPCKRSS